jgi:formate dehydrogenase
LPADRAKPAIETRTTFCRLCEATCGLQVSVSDDSIVSVDPDPDNALSRGFMCIKGKNSYRIVDDPARVLTPLHRAGKNWSTASWETALADIGARLSGIKAAHGPDAIGLYIGNPTAMSTTAAYAASGFLRSLGSMRQYSAMSLDNMNKFVVAELMLGDKSFILQRDWECARYMLVLGANPRVSIFGQLSTRPRGLEDIRSARKQGGRLVLVDPRRTETATVADEHLAIVPGTDCYFLLALIHTILNEGLYDRDFVERYCRNLDRLSEITRAFAPDAVAELTGIASDKIRRVARDVACADGAFVIGNTGVTQQQHACINEWAITALNAITGNIDRKGGAFFNPGVVDDPRPKTIIDYDHPSRIGQYPRLLGEYPAATLADEILTPGKDQMRALIVVAGNPAATGTDIARLRRAFAQLELLVVLDLYRSATTELAHWVLPATSFYERKDLTIQFTRHTPFPFIQYTDRVVAPRGQARDEWDIFRGLHAAVGTPFLGRHADGEQADIDVFFERFLAARSNLSLSEVKQHVHGMKLGEKPIGSFRRLLERRDQRIDLAPPSLCELVPSLKDVRPRTTADLPLLLISRRNLRSVCSWLHVAGAHEQTNYLEINQLDASRLGIEPDSTVIVRNGIGEILTTVKLTDAIPQGVVSMQYGLARGVRTPEGDETTMNRLAASDRDCDGLTGMPTLNGIPVQVKPVPHAG